MRATHVARTADANLQNSINISIIFNYLRERGPSYRAQIAKALNISLPAVSRAIENLIDHGYVVADEQVRTQSGKKVAAVRINIQKGAVLGVDLLSERVRMALFDFSSTVRGSYAGKRLAESTNLVDDLAGEIEKFLADLHRNSTEQPIPPLKALTVGVPAVIDVGTQRPMNAYLYENLEDLDLKAELSRRLGIEVYLENIVKLAALGEHRYGKGKHYKDLVFIQVGNGVGAGIIMDNELVRGAGGAAGEIGFTVTNEESLGYTHDHKGYLEQFASTQGIREVAQRALEHGEQSRMRDMAGGDPAQLAIHHVFAAAADGDEVARTVLDAAVSKLTIAALNLSIVLNPELMVFGGDISSCPSVEELLIEPISAALDRLVPFARPEISVSTLGEDAGVYGASLMAVESLLVGRYPYRIAGGV